MTKEDIAATDSFELDSFQVANAFRICLSLIRIIALPLGGGLLGMPHIAP